MPSCVSLFFLGVFCWKGRRVQGGEGNCGFLGFLDEDYGGVGIGMYEYGRGKGRGKVKVGGCEGEARVVIDEQLVHIFML
ncbi:hypothetical protein GGI42DRAFT_316142 [Trichoderma sp. SZMC 28013]